MADIVRKLQDLRSLTWSERASSSGTAGTYLKARTGTGGRTTYYKLSRFNGLRIDGHECANELIASRLMETLGIEHLSYRLIHATVLIDGTEHETWLNASRNFRVAGERKLGLGAYYELYRRGKETPYEFCLRMGWENKVKQTMLVDYLMANRDRHSSNIEVLVGKDGNARLAPVFDTGMSLVAPLADDEQRVAAFDPMASVGTTNFVGSHSLEKNLELAANVRGIGDLTQGDVRRLLVGLEDVLSETHHKRIEDIIWRRWRHFEDIRAH